MYSVRNIFTQEPETVKGAALTVLAALVLVNAINLSGEATAGFGLMIERVLSLFYVRPLTASKAALNDLSGP